MNAGLKPMIEKKMIWKKNFSRSATKKTKRVYTMKMILTEIVLRFCLMLKKFTKKKLEVAIGDVIMIVRKEKRNK